MLDVGLQVYTLSEINKSDFMRARAYMGFSVFLSSLCYFFAGNGKKNQFLGLTSGIKRVELRSRARARLEIERKEEKEMKTIAIVLGLTALTAAGNTLPPTPENTLPPTPEFIL